jgi:hypothetical protein
MLISLRLAHPSMQLQALVDALPFESNAGWNLGDAWNVRAPHLIRKNYYRAVKLRDFDSLSETIHAICDALDKLDDVNRKSMLDPQLKKTLYCTMQSSDSIKADEIQRLAQWGIGIDLDIYFLPPSASESATDK